MCQPIPELAPVTTATVPGQIGQLVGRPPHDLRNLRASRALHESDATMAPCRVGDPHPGLAQRDARGARTSRSSRCRTTSSRTGLPRVGRPLRARRRDARPARRGAQPRPARRRGRGRRARATEGDPLRDAPVPDDVRDQHDAEDQRADASAGCRRSARPRRSSPCASTTPSTSTRWCSRWDDNADLIKFGPRALVHGLLDEIVDGYFDAIAVARRRDRGASRTILFDENPKRHARCRARRSAAPLAGARRAGRSCRCARS